MKYYKWIVLILLLYCVASTLQCQRNKFRSDEIVPVLDSLDRSIKSAQDSAVFYKRKASRFMLMRQYADSVIMARTKEVAQARAYIQKQLDSIKMESVDSSISALRIELSDSIHPFKLIIEEDSLIAFTPGQAQRFRFALFELPACSLQVRGLEALVSSQGISLAIADSTIESQKKEVSYKDEALASSLTETSLLRQANTKQYKQIKWMRFKVGALTVVAVLVAGAAATLYLAQ